MSYYYRPDGCSRGSPEMAESIDWLEASLEIEASPSLEIEGRTTHTDEKSARPASPLMGQPNPAAAVLVLRYSFFGNATPL